MVEDALQKGILFPEAFEQALLEGVLTRKQVLEDYAPMVRKGLGIYLTPMEVASKIAQTLSGMLPEGSKVYDPACGTGGLLLAASLLGFEVSGSDINPLMVKLAQQCLDNIWEQDAFY